MDYQIMGKPAPRNDLRFADEGRLTVSRREVAVAGKWPLLPAWYWLLVVWLNLILMLLAQHERLPFPVYLVLMVVVIFGPSLRLRRVVRLAMEDVEEVTRAGREITLVYRGTRGPRYGVMHVADAAEAAAIEDAVRAPGEEPRAFAVTHGPLPVPEKERRFGEMRITPERLTLTWRTSARRLGRADRAKLLLTTIALVVVNAVLVMGFLLDIVADFAEVKSLAVFVFILMFIASVTMLAFAVRAAVGSSTTERAEEIGPVRHEGKAVRVRLAGADTVVYAHSSEEAAALADALANRTAGCFPIADTADALMDETALPSPARVSIHPERVILHGRVPGVGSVSVGFFLIEAAFVLALWMVCHIGAEAAFITMPAGIMLLSVLAQPLLPKRVVFPRATLTGVTRRGRQLSFLAPDATGVEKRAVFYARTAADAEAMERELSAT